MKSILISLFVLMSALASSQSYVGYHPLTVNMDSMYVTTAGNIRKVGYVLDVPFYPRQVPYMNNGVIQYDVWYTPVPVDIDVMINIDSLDGYPIFRFYCLKTLDGTIWDTVATGRYSKTNTSGTLNLDTTISLSEIRATKICPIIEMIDSIQSIKIKESVLFNYSITP